MAGQPVSRSCSRVGRHLGQGYAADLLDLALPALTVFLVGTGAVARVLFDLKIAESLAAVTGIGRASSSSSDGDSPDRVGRNDICRARIRRARARSVDRVAVKARQRYAAPFMAWLGRELTWRSAQGFARRLWSARRD